MKKKVFAVSLVLICLSLCAYGTLAAFTTADVARNTITMGSLDVELIENFDEEDHWTESKDEQGNATYTLDSPVLPGQDLVKEPIIVNRGDQDVYVRYDVELDITSSTGEPLVGYVDPNLYAFEDDDESSDAFFYGDDESKKMIRTSHKDWEYTDEDGGWIIYKGILHAGEELPLFDHVQISPQMPNEFQDAVIVIKIKIQAVQAKNNPPKIEGDYTTIAGWPK